MGGNARIMIQKTRNAPFSPQGFRQGDLRGSLLIALPTSSLHWSAVEHA
jgi:hypothetical protein